MEEKKSSITVEVKRVPLVDRPLIYEINTWPWLHDLSRKYGRKINLGTIPREEWDNIAGLGVDAVWFMGVWERSTAGIDVSNHDEALLAEFRQALPNYQTEDNVGSPYCVRNYVVDEHLGGQAGLIEARRELAAKGLSLVLDFVPNHVALDHPWVKKNPDYFVQGNREDIRRWPHSYFEKDGKIIANGRDPYFPPWTDVAQLNPFSSGLRKEVAEIINNIAGQCDAIRCDMAMLLLNDIFLKTWGEKVWKRPKTEYWTYVISFVRESHPDFKFIAEVYWDLEWILQQLGFDYCYDKKLYDHLVHDSTKRVRQHLMTDLFYQEKLVRFIENHDEPRSATIFKGNKARAAAVLSCTLPGAVLIHDGQMEGRRIRLPVFLARRPDEATDESLKDFYLLLLKVLRSTNLRKGSWQLCNRSGWPDNASYINLVAWCWQFESNRMLIVVNLSESSAQGRIDVPWLNPAVPEWLLTDLLSGSVYNRSHENMTQGLFVDLPAWGYHFLDFKEG